MKLRSNVIGFLIGLLISAPILHAGIILSSGGGGGGGGTIGSPIGGAVIGNAILYSDTNAFLATNPALTFTENATGTGLIKFNQAPSGLDGFFSILGTNLQAAQSGINFTITGAPANQQYGLTTTLNATGSLATGFTAATQSLLTGLGTGLGYSGFFSTNVIVAGKTLGGVFATATCGSQCNITTSKNVGVNASSGGSTNSLSDYGVVGSTRFGSTNSAGGVFVLGTINPFTYTGGVAALIADNQANAGNIFLAKDAGTAVFTIPDGGGFAADTGFVYNNTGAGNGILTFLKTPLVATNSAFLTVAGTLTASSSLPNGIFSNIVVGTASTTATAIKAELDASNSGNAAWAIYGSLNGVANATTSGAIRAQAVHAAITKNLYGVYATAQCDAGCTTAASNNVAVYGASAGTVNSTRDYGVFGSSKFGSTNSAGGVFTLGFANPVAYSGGVAALILDNQANAGSIFIAKDNGSAVFTIPDNGGFTSFIGASGVLFSTAGTLTVSHSSIANLTLLGTTGGLLTTAQADLTIRAGSSLAGADQVGNNLILELGTGTGAAIPKEIRLRTAPPLATGSTTQVLATTVSISTKTYAMTDATPINLFVSAVPTSNTNCGTQFAYNYSVSDGGANVASHTGSVTCAFTNAAGTVTGTCSDVGEVVNGTGCDASCNTWSVSITTTNATVRGSFDNIPNVAGTLQYSMLNNSCTTWTRS